MSRFRIEHPIKASIHCYAGHDHALGFFCEVFSEGRSRPIKSLDFFTAGKPVTLQDCFEFMIANEFFTRDDLEQALVAIQDGTLVKSAKVLRVVEAVEGFTATT